MKTERLFIFLLALQLMCMFFIIMQLFKLQDYIFQVSPREISLSYFDNGELYDKESLTKQIK